MPRRLVKLVDQQYYHLYNRGNNRSPLFFERRNYYFFLRQFAKYASGEVCKVHAFCLMPNHYHFLASILDAMEFDKQFRRFLISYAKTINSTYSRCGHLFQGRFHADLIDTDSYFLTASRYIHLNPVVAGLVSSPENWEFSSYRCFIEGTSVWKNPSGSDLEIETSLTLDIAGGLEGYKRFVESTVGEIPFQQR
ncbi:MAG: transposase [Bacteroidota bacterium]